ncbi:MAG: Spo0B domain-containing protein [bacterium]
MQKRYWLLQTFALLLLAGLIALGALIICRIPAAMGGCSARLLLAVCLVCGLVFLLCLRRAGNDAEIEAALQAARREEQSALVQALRMQKHDFANHLQVIAGLAQLGKSERLLPYIQEIAAAGAGLNAYSAICQPEIKTVLLAKAYIAAARRRQLDLVAETDLAVFALDAEKFASYLGSVLDILLEETSESSGETDRFILYISEGHGFYEVTMSGERETIDRLARHQAVGAAIRREFGGTYEFVPLAGGEAKIVLRFPKLRRRGRE